MKLEIPAFVAGEEIWGGSGYEKEVEELDDGSNYWASKMDEDLELVLTKLKPDLKGVEESKRIMEELEEANKAHSEGIQAVESVGNGLTEAGKYENELEKMKKFLPALYDRAPEVVDMEIETFRNFLQHIGDESEIIEQKEGIDLNERDSFGTIFHNLAGNTPLVDISLMNSKALYNTDIVKTASGDPITPYLLAKSLNSEDRSLAESTAVINFDSTVEEGMHPAYEVFVENSDLIDAYGGFSALETMEDLSERYSKKMVDHGPKRALEFVSDKGKSTLDKESLSRKIAKDMIAYEQHACTAPAVTFVEDLDGKELGKMTGKSLNDLYEEFPPTPDSQKMERKENYFIQRKREEDGTVEVITPQKLAKEQGKPLGERGEKFWRVVYFDKDSQLEPRDLQHADQRLMIFKETNSGEVKDWIERYDINDVPLKDYISRFGIEGNEGFEEYVESEMPMTVCTEPGNVPLPNEVGEKHDGVYDLVEFSKESEGYLDRFKELFVS